MNAKISVSLPQELLQRLDSVREAKRLGRSAAIQRAVDQWTRSGELVDLEYLDAYRRVPEDPDEMDAWSRAAAEAWGKSQETATKTSPRRRRRRAAR